MGAGTNSRFNTRTGKWERQKTEWERKSRKKNNGCYVATCVYGSYDCPEVWTLRRFRDYNLAKTWYGRLFINIYYALSPTLVKLFGNTNWFKNMWKPVLDNVVNKLHNKGYEDSPYDDAY